MVENLTDEFGPLALELVNAQRRQLIEMKLPGYVQSTLTFNLLQRTLENATLYHCQRNPRELGEFTWVVDAKDRGSLPTSWERWWTQIMLPTLQGWSFEKPGARLVGGDYRYFEPYLDNEVLPHLKDVFELAAGDPKPTNLSRVFADIRFSSRADAGLELVDVLTNAVRRAMRGNLGPRGWMPIREVMIHRRDHYIALISLNAERDYSMEYSSVLHGFTGGGRGMLTPARLAE